MDEISEKKFLQRNIQKITALIFWLGLITLYQWYASSNNLSPVQVTQQLIGFMKNGLAGVFLYVVLYAIRPLILFPSTILTLAGGFVFGPVLGVLYTIIASNVSSSIAYLVGLFFGEGFIKDSGSDSWVQRYTRRMRENSFETVIIMRFIFLPYDLVSYLAGFLKIKFIPFIIATALGSIPGTIAFVGFGASIEAFDGTLPKLNPATLTFSILIFIASIALSRVFKKREGISK